jgi:hypothetical protein
MAAPATMDAELTATAVLNTPTNRDLVNCSAYTKLITSPMPATIPRSMIV